MVYYFGEKNGAEFQELILVDGQQRISTIVLLLCALRDCEKDAGLQSKITARYLKNDTNIDKFRIRLKQTSYDYQSFLSVVEKTPIKDKDNNIIKNYKRFLELLKKTEISLTDIYNTIQKLEIVGVNLQIENDLETVQTIFEKINSTGKPLSAADLIRNYLLISKSPDEQQRLYDNYWINIERTVGNEFISRLTKNYLIIKTYEDVAKFKDVVSDNIIHKSHNKYRKDEKDPVISMDKSLLVEPKRIGNTDIYSEGSLSSERARVYAKQLLDIFKITNDIQILVEKKEDE